MEPLSPSKLGSLFKKYGSGIGLCLAMGIVAKFLAISIPIGAVALAIIMGIIIGNLGRPGPAFVAGIGFCEKHILSFAIALMGVKLDFTILRNLGYESVLLVISGVIFTLSSALVAGKLFHLDRKFALLLGIGSGICGSSAIAATEKIIGNSEEEVGLSVAIVNALGTLGIFLLPFMASMVLGFSDLNSGLLVGNTLQAVGQVVAGGFAISDVAGQTATIIKMTRILMLFPVVFFLIFVFSKQTRTDHINKPKIPGFIVGFILFSLVPTFNLLPGRWISLLGKSSHIALIVAMAGIGLKITFQSILQNGKSALATGGLIFLLQIIFSCTVIALWF